MVSSSPLLLFELLLTTICGVVASGTIVLHGRILLILLGRAITIVSKSKEIRFDTTALVSRCLHRKSHGETGSRCQYYALDKTPS